MNVKKENSVRIAIPTNDGINIFPGMLGMAREMFIYEIINGTQFRLIEKRNNPYPFVVKMGFGTKLILSF